MHERNEPPPSAANTSSPADNSPPSSSPPGRPPGPDLSPEQVERALADGARRAARTDARTAPSPAQAAFDRALADAGGSIDRARVNVEGEQREAWRGRQVAASPYFFESPEDAAERVERQREGDRARLLAGANVPPRYATASLDDLERVPEGERRAYANAVARLRAAAARPGAIVALCGVRGPGKTHMASALVRERCRALRPARYAKLADYFLAIRSTFAASSTRTEADVEADHVRPDLLVLDEAHETPESDRMGTRLTRLIDLRYDRERVTVLIANVRADAFADLVGESIADRIHDGGGVIECAWPSLRGRLVA